MNSSIVNVEKDNNSLNSMLSMSHKKKSCDLTLNDVQRLAVDIKDLNMFLESNVSLPGELLSQLKELRVDMIDKLEFSLSFIQHIEKHSS